MRRISFGLAVVGLFFVACGGDEAKPQPVVPATTVATTPPATTATAEPPKEAPKPSLGELEKKTSEGIAAAINAHDAKKVASFYTEGAIIKTAGMPDLNGREAIAAMWQKNFDRMPNGKSAASRVLVKGDVVVVEWAFNGTHTGDIMGAKSTEKPVGFLGADVMWFSPDGLVKEQHTYFDMGTIMSQLGVSKHKGRAIPALPTGAPAVVVSTGTAEETKDVDAANKMFAAFEKKSEADFLASASDDVTWDDLTQPEASKGKAAAKKYFGELTKAFPDLKSSMTNVWGIGDFVVGEGTLSGTHKAAFFGIQPTKKSMNLHGLDVMQFKDGKVVAGRSYGNGMEFAMQLGLIPTPKAPAAKTDAKPAPAGKTAPKPAAPAKK